MKTKYSVTHNGKTYTRTTARTYTHIVLTGYSLKEMMAQAAEAGRAHWYQNKQWYTAIAEGKYVGHDKRLSSAEAIRDAKDWLNEGPSGNANRWVNTQIDRANEAGLQADGDTYYVVAGWAGREDLARKLVKGPRDLVLAVAQ